MLFPVSKHSKLVPALRVKQNSEAIVAQITSNLAFYVACGFTSHSTSRILRDFDQIMCEYELWNAVHDMTTERTFLIR